MDQVFRALADPHRRNILDHLVARDGQTLTELSGLVPDLTRFGVMNHLRVLQAAGLVTTRKSGCFTYHYLNPIPIRMLADRWISAFAAPVSGALTHLKRTVEEPAMTDPEPPAHVYVVIINAAPERVWQGLTDPGLTRQYYFDSSLRSPLAVGGRFDYVADDGTVLLAGDVLEIDPPRRLVTTFSALWDADVSADPPSRISFVLEPLGAAGTTTRLIVTHDGFAGRTATYEQVGGGLPHLMSGLKTLLETGSALRVG